MGAGASVETIDDAKKMCKSEVGVSDSQAWKEANDIKDLKQAKSEIKRLRGLACKFALNPSASAGGGGGGARAAVVDRLGAGAAKGPYVKKTVPKSATIGTMINDAIKDNVLFAKMDAALQKEMVEAFYPQSASKGEKVIKQGEKGDVFFVLESGAVEFSVLTGPKDMPVGQIDKPGAAFGELALMYGTPRAATCTCTIDTKLWCLDRAAYRGIVANMNKTKMAFYVKLLKDVTLNEKKLGDVMSDNDITKLCEGLEREVYPAGSVIIRQGEAGDYFYVIESGDCDVHVEKAAKGRASMIGGDSKVATLGPGKSFGEKALLSEDVRAASIKAATEVVVLTLSRDDFVMMFGNLQDIGKPGAAEEAAPVSTSERKQETMAMSDIVTVRTLGHGAFGRVKLVSDHSGKKAYALKCQGKAAIVENALQDHILMERHILMVLDHPFVVTLFAALQDSKYIYFVLELLLGGELFTWLRKNGRFEEAQSKFYSAQVVLAFQHMHSKKVAYRDLKPENLVLDHKGYLKVVDLGLAKIVDGKTWTLCGTPDYLAPEIILNEGHDKGVDYWALGVLIYELVAGIPPFYADDPMEVYEKILSSNMTFPNHFTKNLCDICKKLLKLCQSKRLGNGKGGCTGILKHKWFSGFDWDGLLHYALTPPIKVEVKDPLDASNFDNYEEEPEVMEECDWSPDLTSAPTL